MFASETIYKYDQAGKLRLWCAEIAPCGTKYRSHAGIFNGTVVATAWTQVHGNAQRPDAVAQCRFEVNALYEYRLARTYHLTAEAAKAGAHFFEPMLAQPLERTRLWFMHADHTEHEAYTRPYLYIQPKLDGMRCIATADGMFSRQGKEIISAPHIAAALRPYFEQHPDVILDGELYSDALAEDFSKIMSLAKKKKPTDADLRQSERYLEYHIYDMPSLDTAFYLERINAVNDMVQKVSDLMPFGKQSPLRAVETIGIIAWDQWDEHHASWRAKKYEGSIGRRAEAVYQQRRTHDLIKRKDFDSCEFDVSGVGEGEGNWAGACKQIYCWLPIVPAHERTPARAKDEKFTFKATPTGSYEYLRSVLEGEVPSRATVEYMGWSSTDIPKPRHTIAKQLYWGDRDD